MFQYDLCFQQGAGTVTPFNDFSPLGEALLDTVHSWSAAGSLSLPAGTYSVGFCVLSNVGDINLVSNVTGGVMTTAAPVPD